MGLAPLTFQQLFEYLEQGEKDPFIEHMLEVPGNRERLRRARRLYDLVKNSAAPDKGPRVAGFAESMPEFGLDYSDQSLQEDLLDAEGMNPFEKGEAGESNQSEDGLHRTVLTMRRGGEQLRLSGTLRVDTSGKDPVLDYVPDARRAASDEPPLDIPAFLRETPRDEPSDSKSAFDPGAMAFQKGPAPDRGKQEEALGSLASSPVLVKFVLRPLRVSCRIDLSAGAPQLVFEVQDTRWHAPAKQLEVLYVPGQGKILRAATDLKGRATLPLPAASGRLRFDTTPAIALDIEIRI